MTAEQLMLEIAALVGEGRLRPDAEVMLIVAPNAAAWLRYVEPDDSGYLDLRALPKESE